MTEAGALNYIESNSRCAVIVAHPDDETLWVGGLILMHPQVSWTIVTICRKSDPDRAPKFFEVVRKLNADGFMADLDDGPEQKPLDNAEIQDTIMQMLPLENYDLVITHGRDGEYTRHLRHEETSTAVLELCNSGRLLTGRLWMFAYEDGDREYLPRAIEKADIKIELNDEIWREKYKIITNIYGFDEYSFEAKTTPRIEAFRLVKLDVKYSERS